MADRGSNPGGGGWTNRLSDNIRGRVGGWDVSRENFQRFRGRLADFVRGQNRGPEVQGLTDGQPRSDGVPAAPSRSGVSRENFQRFRGRLADLVGGQNRGPNQVQGLTDAAQPAVHQTPAPSTERLEVTGQDAVPEGEQPRGDGWRAEVLEALDREEEEGIPPPPFFQTAEEASAWEDAERARMEREREEFGRDRADRRADRLNRAVAVGQGVVPGVEQTPGDAGHTNPETNSAEESLGAAREQTPSGAITPRTLERRASREASLRESYEEAATEQHDQVQVQGQGQEL